MNKTEIIVITSAFVLIAIRLYQKYIRKNKGNQAKNTKMPSGSIFNSASKDDEYEPYAKK
jgi:hypothetical protein